MAEASALKTTRGRLRWMRAVTLVSLLTGLGFFVWLWEDGRSAPPHAPVEQVPRTIPLMGPVAAARAELSGLAWDGDRLLLMPQYPRRFGRGQLFVLERAEIVRAIRDDQVRLRPRSVPFETRDFESHIARFDGFEGIAVRGDHVYLTVEVRAHDGITGHVVRGHIDRTTGGVVLEPEHLADLPRQTAIANLGYEALVVTDRGVYLFYEANGVVNRRQHALVFDHDLRNPRQVQMDPLEYRVTDATEVDQRGRFFVANYHWPGSPWESGACRLTRRYGQGRTHSLCAAVERLVELQVDGESVRPSGRPPIQLQLLGDERARNWEGIVRLRGLGFLLVTDEHPSTMLAFVPDAA